MELHEPKPKKHCRLKPNLPLPIDQSERNTKMKGYFNGFSVVIDDMDQMKRVVSQGYFGKANFSRSYPQLQSGDQAEIIRKRVFEARKKFEDKTSNKPRKVLVIPDSEDETDDYFKNLKPEYQLDYSGLTEKVYLAPEEAFFLQSAVKCLELSYNGRELDENAAFHLFHSFNQYFFVNYVVYYHFRAKNWVVKPGLKFGGEYLLYKQGPPFYHASYVVIISVIDENGQEIKKYKRCSMTNVHLMGLNRLCEACRKELLICQVVWPENFEKPLCPADISRFRVKEVLMRRWTPTKDQNEQDDDD